MKKLIFFIVATIFTNNAIAQFTLIPDTNFEKALISQGYDDLRDGKVLSSNISSVKDLFLSNKNIFDLTGIQDFKSLEYLGANSNKLTYLDVSKNDKLVELGLYHNLLTDLNLSNNPNLYALHCAENKLTSLDLSNNPLIEELDCQWNQLTTINLKNGSSLIINPFVTFNNPNLFCIYVSDPLFYETEMWHGLDPWTRFTNRNCNPLTTETEKNTKFKIFPNPTNDFIIIEGLQAELNQIEIFDIKGSLLINKEISNNENKVDVKPLSKGIYFVKLSRNNKTYFAKIIKE
jgi:hypothetical protein